MMTKNKIYISFALVFLMMGCVTHKKSYTQACPNGSCRQIKDIKPRQAMSADDTYVSYTEVAADYKAYGERTPLDHRVGTSGKASNLSSSIPPVIEEEVVLYENELNGIADIQDAASQQDLSASSEVDAQDAAAIDDPVEDWLAEEGMNLKDLLTQWSERSGWRLVWKTNRNYTLTAGAMFRARYADAASALVRAFARARPAPIATFYKGNRVLVIETMEDENAYE